MGSTSAPASDAVKKMNLGEFAGRSLLSLVGAVYRLNSIQTSGCMRTCCSCLQRAGGVPDSLRLRVLNRQQLQPSSLLRLEFFNVVFKLKHALVGYPTAV